MFPMSPFPFVFVGDGIVEEDANEWLRQVRLYSLGREEEDKIKVFELCLAPGSPAEAWYDHLESRTRNSFKAIVHEFKKVYPPVPYMPLPSWLPLERLEQCVLRNEDVGRDVVEEHTGLLLPSHIAYARRIRRLAAALAHSQIDESEATLVADARRRLPAAIRAAVSKQIQTWDQYVTAILYISASDLEKTMEGGDAQAYDPRQRWHADPRMGATHPGERTKYSVHHSYTQSASSDLPPPPHVTFQQNVDPMASQSIPVPVHVTSPTDRIFPTNGTHSPIRANGTSRGTPYVNMAPYTRDTPSAPPSTTHPAGRSWLSTNHDRSPNGSGSGSGSNNGHGGGPWRR